MFEKQYLRFGDYVYHLHSGKAYCYTSHVWEMYLAKNKTPWHYKDELVHLLFADMNNLKHIKKPSLIILLIHYVIALVGGQ